MLERLPPELLSLVGEWLDLIKPYSFLELLWTSKYCYSTLVAISFRTLTFSTDLKHLEEDVKNYSRLLKGVEGLERSQFMNQLI